MTEDRPSSTAIGAAMLRASHRLVDTPPLLLDDPLALPLSGLPSEVAVHAALARLQAEFESRNDAAFAQELLRQLRASILLRNRYAEDELERAFAAGVRQYVMLGAGLDSFAWRRPDLADQLQIFEIDLPVTQDWKRSRLAQLGLPSPPSLHFVSADLTLQSPLQALAGCAFHLREPAFFSWLGVTGYLTEEAVHATLRDIAGAAPGSGIVFSYGLRESLMGEDGRRINAALKAGIAARNEPAANDGFDPDDLAARLHALGYSQLQDLSAAKADARYFADRHDGLRAPPMTRLLSAQLG